MPCPRRSYVSTHCLLPWPEEEQRRAEENLRIMRDEILRAGGVRDWMKEMDLEPGPPNCPWGGRG